MLPLTWSQLVPIFSYLISGIHVVVEKLDIHSRSHIQLPRDAVTAVWMVGLAPNLPSMHSRDCDVRVQYILA